MDDGFIRTESLKKTYLMGKVEVSALRGVDITVHGGEFVALMGPSGSGKSTMLNQVGLLDTPSSGSIYIDNENTSAMKENKRVELRLNKFGFIFQFFSLFMELSTLENVMLPMMLSGEPKKECKDRAIELLDIVELGDRQNHMPSELSGGQQQRVAIARSLMNRPKLILADEPTANLDSNASVEIIELFKKLNRETGVTLLMVTHEEELGKLADRIIWLRDGKIDVEKQFVSLETEEIRVINPISA